MSRIKIAVFWRSLALMLPTDELLKHVCFEWLLSLPSRVILLQFMLVGSS